MISLTQSNLLDLVIKGYTTINDQRLYFKAKAETESQASVNKMAKDKLFATTHLFFLLSPHYSELTIDNHINY